ncbi:hypothetical protein ACFLUG_03525 [Chloroflexota bacterium]
MKAGDGISFIIAVPADDLAKICSERTAGLLSEKHTDTGRAIIGSFIERDPGTDPGAWPAIQGDEKLNEYIIESVTQFISVVNHFGSWTSFNDFQKIEIQYDAKSTPVLNQQTFEYWWLVSESKGDGPLHSIPLYENNNVFIRPDDRIIPVYTSGLYADIANRNYSLEHGIHLVPKPIHCPGCYFTGLGGFLGRQLIRGGLLNEQWQIHFFTCEDHKYTSPSHFRITDTDGDDYELIGCPDKGTRPLWITRKWDQDEEYFSNDCNPLPWDTSNPN